MVDTFFKPSQRQDFQINGCELKCESLVRAVNSAQSVNVMESCWKDVQWQREIVDEIVRNEISAYGVTTGVGSQKDYCVSENEASIYNMRLVRAHATRVPKYQTKINICGGKCGG